MSKSMTRAVLPLLLVGLFMVSACSARSTSQEPAGELVGQTYGDGVKGEPSVSISDILADPKLYDGKVVRVEGTITDVCPMRGCWFDVEGDAPGTEMRFKVRDGVMEFPMTAIGKHAVAEGVVTVHELTLEETRRYVAHLAEEKGEAFDPATVTEAETLVQLAGTGAVIREKR